MVKKIIDSETSKTDWVDIPQAKDKKDKKKKVNITAAPSSSEKIETKPNAAN
jgi:hypothetical protein